MGLHVFRCFSFHNFILFLEISLILKRDTHLLQGGSSSFFILSNLLLIIKNQAANTYTQMLSRSQHRESAGKLSLYCSAMPSLCSWKLWYLCFVLIKFQGKFNLPPFSTLPLPSCNFPHILFAS